MRPTALFATFVILVFGTKSLAAQDLQLQVRVQSQNVQTTDRSVFEAMELSLQEFANNTKWSTRETDFVERLQGSLVFNITEYNLGSGNMTGTLQIKFSRPVFKSDYESNLLFFLDQGGEVASRNAHNVKNARAIRAPGTSRTIVNGYLDQKLCTRYK